MRTSRALGVGGASAAILTAGVIAAPEPLEDAEPLDDAVAAPDPGGDAEPGTAAPGADASAGDSSGASTVDGPVVSNIRGDYQVRLHIEDGVVVDIEFPVAGTSAGESRRVNDMALPVLEERMIEAQSGDVEYVSGASYTSPAMVESAQAAFADAGL